MSAIFILKEEPPKKNHKFFIFLKGCYFVIGGSININVEVFWETSMGFPKYIQSSVNLNVKSRTKFNCLYKVEELFQGFSFEFNL